MHIFSSVNNVASQADVSVTVRHFSDPMVRVDCCISTRHVVAEVIGCPLGLDCHLYIIWQYMMYGLLWSSGVCAMESSVASGFISIYVAQYLQVGSSICIADIMKSAYRLHFDTNQTQLLAAVENSFSVTLTIFAGVIISSPQNPPPKIIL